MSDITLYIGNKNYSAPSLVAWLACKQAGVDFEEVVIPLRESGTREAILRHSPSGKVPALKEGGLVVWDSLAICEHLGERFRDANLWPADVETRAVARSICAEVHSGFLELRRNMPMNMRSSFPGLGMTPEVQEEINRVTAIWHNCRKRFGGGDFLFAGFTITDAMFAPVVSRLTTYGVELDKTSGDYVSTIWDMPAMQEWLEAARKEPWIIPDFEF